MCGLVRIKCAKCKEWISKGEELCGECRVNVLVKATNYVAFTIKTEEE